MLLIKITTSGESLTIEREQAGEVVARLSLSLDWFKSRKKTPKNEIIKKWTQGASNAEEARAQLLAL